MPKKETDKKSIVSLARKRFEKALEVYGPTRRQAIEDTRFVMGDSDNGWQWPDDIRSSRVLDKRVCLTVNLTAQHCNQIVNAIRQNRPAVKVSPVDNGADKKTAEILGSLIRNIQNYSCADDVHDIAAEFAIYGGEGYWRLLTEYADTESMDQIIKIAPIFNPQLVFVDPDAREIDKSDAEWGFIFEDLPREQVERDHPGITIESWSEATRLSGWFDKDRGLIRVAEYFYCEHETDTLYALADGSTCLKAKLPADAEVINSREVDIRKWHWCKIVGGQDAPIDSTEWLGDYLPIISVIGKELNVNGTIIRKGIVRDLKDPARMVNYAYSECVQSLALQNKVPYMAAAEALEGYEQIWGNANVENRAYLPYNAFDETGNQLPQPTRQQPPIMPAAQVELLQLSVEQMRAASGQQNSNFGIKSEAQSGIGIQRLKAQGEVATFHFPDNLARALRYEAKLLVNLVQKYYDTKRIVRILGLDGVEKNATLHPGLSSAYMEQPDAAGQEVERIFNPTVGRYDVTIDTGPSYMTQRQEGAAALNELASRDPDLMKVAGDLIMRAQDFPFAEELAQRLARTIPPNIMGDDAQNPRLVQANRQIQQLTQQNQAMEQQLRNAHNALDAREVAVKEYDAETKRITAVQAGLNEQQIQEIVLGTIHGMISTGDIQGTVPARGSFSPDVPDNSPPEATEPGELAPQ